jgi:putative transposase
VSGVKILSATVSEKAGRWFVSLQVEQESAFAPEGSGIIGVDVGIKSLAMTSDGEVFDNPKALQCANKRVRLAQKAVARKIKGSNNRRKAVRRLARQNYRVTCVRQDAIHKATTAITKQASVIVIESLSVVGMMKNRHLAQAIGDAGLSEIHRQLRYKAEWRGAVVVEADRFFPSSKMCSECGHVKDALLLSERVYICEVCGLVIDRDLNASINLKNLAGSSPVSACRPGSAGRDQSVAAKLLVGQEPSRERAHV